MHRAAVWIAAACLASIASAVAAASDAAGARAFVEGLYSHYPSNPDGMVFDPTGKSASEVFDPGMIAAFRKDARLSNGEVGFVDADPLCQCQDDSGLKPKVVSVTMTGPDAADAVVNLQYPEETVVLTLHLVPVNGAWRIYDLSTKDVKSYRADLSISAQTGPGLSVQSEPTPAVEERSSPESMEGTRARRAVPSRATERRAWGGAVGPRGRSAMGSDGDVRCGS